ncbi:MAG: acetate kinase [Bacteroidota bacterium]
MKILVLNTGSSSIKFQLFTMPDQAVIASGLVEKIGEEMSAIRYNRTAENLEHLDIKHEVLVRDHADGLTQVVTFLMDDEKGVLSSPKEILAVGHRVVHGGDQFSQPAVIEEDILSQLKQISYLAPLHNPACIKGIEVATETFENATQVAVFDTAFHQSIPEHAYRFAIPSEYYEEHGLRSYGFHGTSHRYVMKQAAQHLEIDPEQFNAITIHLGNGCSMAAIKNGKCIDTSMGLTPLGGLIMGTRSGDIDPSVLLFLSDHLEMSTKEIDQLLNKKSGLKGLTGTNDLRSILDQYDKGDKAAQLAIAMYVYRIKKYIGAYAAALGELDALVFTAGVGENSAIIRNLICEDLGILGIELDNAKNASNQTGTRSIQSEISKVSVLVAPTNEELEIALQTFEVVSAT